MNLVVYTVVAMLPVAAFGLLARALEWWVRDGGTTRARPSPASPPLERSVRDLRRLDLESRRLRQSDLPHRAVRLRGVELAYDDALCACCRALGIPCPARRPLGAVDRLGLEAALAREGVVW